jgi:hypothetical protein
MQGRDREAGVVRRIGSINDRVEALRIAWENTSSPVEKARAYERYQAAARAAGVEVGAVRFDDREEVRRQRIDSSRMVSNSDASARFNRMRASGTESGEHAADLAEQDYAAYSDVRSLDDQIAKEHEPEREAQLRKQRAAAVAKAEAEVEANHAKERMRIRQSVSELIIERDRAELSEHEKDYKLATRIFEEEWDKRLATAKTASERQAMLEVKAAQKRAMDAKELQNLRRSYREGVEGYMTAAGRPEMAGAIEGLGNVEEELREAGGDRRQRAAIAFRARGRLQAEARGMIQAGVYGSSADYLQSAQASVLSGSSSVLSFLQKEYQGLGKVMHGGGDNELFAAGKALSDAAEKLGRQNIFVLKD